MRSPCHPAWQNLSTTTIAMMNGCVAWFLTYNCIHTVISCLVILHLADTGPDMSPSSFQVNLILSSDLLMREFLMRLASEQLHLNSHIWTRWWSFTSILYTAQVYCCLFHTISQNADGVIKKKKKDYFLTCSCSLGLLEQRCDVLQRVRGVILKQTQSQQINHWLKKKLLSAAELI